MKFLYIMIFFLFFVSTIPLLAHKADSIKYEKKIYKTTPQGELIAHVFYSSLKLNRSLPDWNIGKSIKDFGQPTRLLHIADDVIGGIFILNGGGLGPDVGKIYYFSPDNLEYEPLDLTYTDFLNFCFTYDLDEFYKGYRWEN